LVPLTGDEAVQQQQQQQLAAAQQQQLSHFEGQLMEAAQAVAGSREAATQQAARAEAAEASVLQLQQQAQAMEQHYIGQLQALQQQYERLRAAEPTAGATGSPRAKGPHMQLEQQGSAQHSMACGLPSSRSLASEGVGESEGIAASTSAAAAAAGSEVEPAEAAAGDASPMSGAGQRQGSSVVRRERGAAGSVVVDIELGGAAAADSPGQGAAGDAAVGGSSRLGRAAGMGGVMGQVVNRLSRVASGVAAAVRAAEGRGNSSADGSGYGSDDDEAGEGLVGRGRQGLGLNRQKLQLGTLRPFGAIPAVRSAHPQVQTALARADGVWVSVLRVVSGSPLSRVGLMGYLLLLHVLVLWVRMSCHPAAAAAVGLATGGGLGPASAAAAQGAPAVHPGGLAPGAALGAGGTAVGVAGGATAGT
jgi:hypothetical protein